MIAGSRIDLVTPTVGWIGFAIASAAAIAARVIHRDSDKDTGDSSGDRF